MHELYVPQDERTLRHVQRKGEQLDRSVRLWTKTVTEVLPRGLPLLQEEVDVLGLFLAQQRRLNLEMDAQNPEATLRTRLGRVVPFVAVSADMAIIRAVHRIVATQIESDIDRTCGCFCQDREIPPISDPAIDWRVAIRYMAQVIHRVASQIDLRKDYAVNPRRFELALLARETAAEVADRRRRMLAAFDREAV